MIKKIPNERWKEIKEVKGKLKFNYAISDQGRLVSFTKKIHEGELLKCSRQEKFSIWRYKINGKNKGVLIHKIVANYFLPKPKGKKMLVIHLDHDLQNNKAKNLKWVPMLEQRRHSSKSPASKLALKKLLKFNRDRPVTKGQKLTIAQAKQIKQTLANPKRTITNRALAKKFKVSEMQIYRIKRGELWKRVKI
ncbi:MAG TPA: NUMOD4 domain-containing protein [Bacteroidia bacterium]|nr:NUMOD4 domain-containing protein [Bacteroidia bacterium]